MPCDRENESVAKALEYAYDDWCISIFADALNDYDTRDKYARFAKAYEFYFDPETRFMRDWTVRGNGALRSTHVHLLTATTTIAKELPGSGPGLSPTISKVW